MGNVFLNLPLLAINSLSKLWLALVIATHSCAWLGTAVLVTNMRNFPLSRGTVAGILKGYIGLSAAVYTEIYNSVLQESASKLLLFLTLGLPVLCFALILFRTWPFPFHPSCKCLSRIYLLATTVVDDLFNPSDVLSNTFTGIMVIFLLFGSSDSLVQEKEFKPDRAFVDTILISNFSWKHASGCGRGAIKKKRKPKREDFKFREAFIKADFWLLWLVYFLGVGSGVTVLNNLAQIGCIWCERHNNIIVSLQFCNFLGRLFGGVVSEYFVRTRTLPRTIWMTFSQVIMVVTFLLYASALSGTLYASTALLGICYRVQFSTMVPCASELFGLKHFGVIYNFMLLGNPIGALLFSGLLAGYVYDFEAAKQQSSTCLGGTCFRLTFLVLAGACGLGTILSIILTIRIKPVYQMLYAGGSFRLPSSSNQS
ncbi:hypothetical protein AAG906_021368 [Vitis piasezkii]